MMIDLDELKNVLFEVNDGVAFVTINRPKALNALNSATLDELEAVFGAIRADADVGAVIVTGAGDKAFVAGADIKELARMSPLEAKEASEKGHRVFDAVENCGKVVIAAINGYALGGGLELALACHIRLATDDARIGLPEVTLGLIPGYGGTQRLARLCGVGRALEMIASGDGVRGERAEQWGVVNRTFPADELMEHAEAFARKVAKRGPIAVRYATEAVLAGSGMTLEDGLKLERDLFGLCFATVDMREGTKAFMEKRKPTFVGR